MNVDKKNNIRKFFIIKKTDERFFLGSLCIIFLLFVMASYSQKPSNLSVYFVFLGYVGFICYGYCIVFIMGYIKNNFLKTVSALTSFKQRIFLIVIYAPATFLTFVSPVFYSLEHALSKGPAKPIELVIKSFEWWDYWFLTAILIFFAITFLTRKKEEIDHPN